MISFYGRKRAAESAVRSPQSNYCGGTGWHGATEALLVPLWWSRGHASCFSENAKELHIAT